MIDNLKGLLAGMVPELTVDLKFSVDGLDAESRNVVGNEIRRDAIEHADDLYPLFLFMEWVNRSPEVQACMAKAGIVWHPVASGATPADLARVDVGNATADPTPSVQAPPAPPAAPLRVFYAKVDPRHDHVQVQMLKVVGGMIQVQRLVAGHCGPITFITLAAVRPDQRAGVQAMASQLGGAQDELTFNPFEGGDTIGAPTQFDEGGSGGEEGGTQRPDGGTPGEAEGGG